MAIAQSSYQPAAPSWIDASLYPFAHRWIDIDDHRVHYLDEGAGPTLLFLHGNPTWSFLYREIIRGLRDRYRCIAPDYPGFGLSVAGASYRYTPAEHAAVVERLVETMDLRDVTLMVHDWGGPIGLGVAGKHPDRFRALILGNTFAWSVNGDPKFERFSRLMGGPVGWLLIRYFNAFVNLLIPFGVGLRKLPRQVMEHYRQPFRGAPHRRVPTYRFPRAILHGRAYLEEVAAALPRLSDKPALIVWGDKDPAFGATERERFERLFPHHHTVILGGAAHYIQEDAPAEIVQAIRTWMPEVGSAGGGS